MIKLKNIINEVSKPKSIIALYTERHHKLFKILMDDKKVNTDFIKDKFSITIPYRYDERILDTITKQFKKLGITFTYNDYMDVS